MSEFLYECSQHKGKNCEYCMGYKYKLKFHNSDTTINYFQIQTEKCPHCKGKGFKGKTAFEYFNNETERVAYKEEIPCKYCRKIGHTLREFYRERCPNPDCESGKVVLWVPKILFRDGWFTKRDVKDEEVCKVCSGTTYVERFKDNNTYLSEDIEINLARYAEIRRKEQEKYEDKEEDHENK